MTQAILSQLMEAESKLTEQEVVLSTQISALQEKRRGLQSVISMFESADGSSIGIPDLASATAPITAPAAESAPKKRRGRKPKATTKSSKTPTKATAPSSKSTAVTPAVKQSGSRRRGGRKANWQTYVRPGYDDTPLPEVVESVLKTKPRSRFKIAEVMTEIFRDDMPKTQFLKARNRISNILSAGARSGEWHRGRGGTYSVSEKAVS
ncbi:MAG: hypothetical protein AAFU53_06560 [Cyanobacteria bacterium J06632_3]